MSSPSHDQRSTAGAVAAARRPAYLDLFAISFVILFLELASIRWIGSTVVYMTFFTNFVLMACFLGMSVGCLAASRRRDLVRMVLPLTVATVGLSYAMLFAYHRLGRALVDVGVRGSAQQVFFGTEFRAGDPASFVVPIEVVAGVFYVLIALMFVGLGQVLGRAFDAAPNRLAAYTTNVVGSLVGIVAFALASRWLLPPVTWFAVTALIVLYFARPLSAFQIVCAVALVTGVPLVDYVEALRATVITYWSPYYKVAYQPRTGFITTNNIGHQTMIRVGEAGSGHLLPHLVNKDAGGTPFDDVLIIGAGSGNDVQAALIAGAKHVDAVEIEPVINWLGRRDHPDRPYDDPRVTVHIDDGRSYLHKTTKQYDLIAYGLVDSLVLHSGFSSLRLESFLFTEEALRDVRARLKPGGVFVMYNMYRQGWIVVRLRNMLEKVFGAAPVVMTWPDSDATIDARSAAPSLTFLMVGSGGGGRVEAIRKAFRDGSSYWLNRRPVENLATSGFGPTPPIRPGMKDADWERLRPTLVDPDGGDRLATDDWPFLYVRAPTIPRLNLRGMAMVAGLSLLILLAFAPVRRVRPDGRMFFLGAGFMLLETKGVVHMALLFGSTWVVNSIVFFAILVMVLLANLYVLVLRPRRLGAYYALLIVSLLVNAFVPMSHFLDLPGAARVLASCSVVFVPVFFAGVIFAAAFRDSTRPDVDFGSNIGGVILGGLSEYLSMMIGFNHLLFVAIGFYALSALLGGRARASATLPTSG
jgi:spermidine synthase